MEVSGQGGAGAMCALPSRVWGWGASRSGTGGGESAASAVTVSGGLGSVRRIAEAVRGRAVERGRGEGGGRSRGAVGHGPDGVRGCRGRTLAAWRSSW